jgi:hypothetical protein
MTIEFNQTVDGRPADVAYFDDNMRAATPDVATTLKIMFHSGEVMFAREDSGEHEITDVYESPDYIKGEGGRMFGSRPRAGGEEEHTATVMAIATKADKVATDLGFDSTRIDIVPGTREFEVNGVKHTAAGDADIYSGALGRIRLYKDHLPLDSVEGVTAHEVEHMKFQSVMDAYHAESKEVMADPGPLPNPAGKYYWEKSGGTHGLMKPDGGLRAPYDKQYPTYSAIQETLYAPSIMDFSIGDGVSNYSAEYWKGFQDGTVPSNIAMHETLAEMARIKYTTGKFPEHYGYSRIIRERNATRGGNPEFTEKPAGGQSAEIKGTKMWRDLYRTVDRVYAAQHKISPRPPWSPHD